MNGKNNNIIIFIYTLFYLLLTAVTVYAQKTVDKALETETAIKKIDKPTVNVTKKNKHKAKKQKIVFSYEDEDLVNVINFLAAQKGVNIVLPQGANAIKEKITLHFEEKINIDEAWTELLPTILDTAGLSIEPKDGLYAIVKNTKDIGREPMPIFIGTSYEKLPLTDQRIRYLYYLSNIKISESAEGELSAILKDLLPVDALFKTDALTNAIIISAKSNDIKGVMKIITQLDQVTFQEKMKKISLQHASARIVADLFNENILKPATEMNRYRLDTRKQTEASFFSRQAKIIAVERTNSVILLGKVQAVNRIKEFIQKYIDVELESGKSILHIYQLLYLDAEKFEPVLKKIVESTRPGGTEQARGTTAAGGTERFFDEVIIKADKPGAAEELNYYGGNKLIIACRNDDWKQIKQLIEELDTPQPQVLIEILIADLTIDDQRLLGSLTRNPSDLPLFNNINYQSAHINPGIITDSNEAPTTVAADLLRKAFDNSGKLTSKDSGATKSAAAFTEVGGAVISLNDNDGQTWSLIKLLKSFGHTKILSHPHVIATNNQEALVRIGESRLVAGESAGTTGGAAVQKFETINAELKVEIKPRISSAEIVNIQVVINIDEFILGSDSRITRHVTTNANVNSGSILALGGLIKTRNESNVKETPVLSKIPILGWFFKQRGGKLIKTNLTVFISPTIIEPRLRHGISKYTKDYISVAKNYAKEGSLFETLKEPVTRWFFKTDTDAQEILDDFLQKDEFKIDINEKSTAAKEIDLKKQEKKRKRKTYNQKPIKDIDKKQEAEKLKTLFTEERSPLLVHSPKKTKALVQS